MFRPTRPPVQFGVSAAYQKENGLWYVTVTIDNMNCVERLANDDEKPMPLKTKSTVSDSTKAPP